VDAVVVITFDESPRGTQAYERMVRLDPVRAEEVMSLAVRRHRAPNRHSETSSSQGASVAVYLPAAAQWLVCRLPRTAAAALPNTRADQESEFTATAWARQSLLGRRH
jgi:hypothetical protein